MFGRSEKRSSQTLASGPHRISAQHWGKPGGRSVILVHGLIVSSQYMTRLGRELGNDHDVVAPDLPGFGRSSKPAHVLDTSELGAVLAEWMIETDIAESVVVGHSYGSQIATAAVSALADQGEERRVSHLVLIGPTTDRRARSRRAHILRWLQCFPLEPIAMLPVEIADLIRCGPRRAWKTFHHMVTDEPVARLSTIEAPALVMRGRYDHISPADWVAEIATQLKAEPQTTLAGAGHSVNMRKPRLVANEIRRFTGEKPESLPVEP